MKENRFKKRIFDIIQVGSKTDLLSNLFDFFIVIIIMLNISVLIFETFEQSVPYSAVLSKIESVTTIIFTIEYILRVWTAEYLFPDKKPISAKFSFVISFFGMIDLLSILPFFLPMLFPTGMVAFRIFRVIRIFRLFRINSRYDAFNIIADVIKEKSNQLFSSIVIIFMLMLASSMIMYSLEHEAQPDLYENAFSGIWWSVSALLTVGYGDIYPITLAGRIMAIIISFLGVGLVSIPTGIMSAGFVEKYTQINTNKVEHDIADNNLHYGFIYSKVLPTHSWVGRKISEIEMPPGLTIAVIKRDDKMMIPLVEDEILAGDVCMLQMIGDKNG